MLGSNAPPFALISAAVAELAASRAKVAVPFITFITPLRGEIVDYIKKQRYKDDKNILSSVSLNDIETKYKEDWEKRMLYYANTSSSGVH